MADYLSVKDSIKKLEHFCAYQERCHDEVVEKARSLKLSGSDIDQALVHLINNNYLNEERFARAFARGKHNIKKWGLERIKSELKARNISQYNINAALKEISPDDYHRTFEQLSENHWESIRETDVMKKRKKFCDYLLRKGYESDMIYARMKELESGS